MISRLVTAVLKNDGGPFPYSEGTRLVFPEVTEAPDAKGKVIIYVEFVQSVHLLQQGLRYDGHSSTVITGQVPQRKRQSLIKLWKLDPSKRILILSSVGNAGLNLAEASHLIFAVGCHRRSDVHGSNI